jgi:hypothetical protein
MFLIQQTFDFSRHAFELVAAQRCAVLEREQRLQRCAVLEREQRLSAAMIAAFRHM